MKIVIALGGNALGNSPSEQKEKVAFVAKSLSSLVKEGHSLILTHGNGPQVGAIKNAFDIAAKADSKIPNMPLAESTSMSQGYIGSHLQNAIQNELSNSGVVSLVTQVKVDANDPAFSAPTKPIGAFISEEEANSLMAANPGVTYIEDSGRGFRQVVASPKPQAIIEIDTLKKLVSSGVLVIAAGGGGIPVVKTDKGLTCIDCVIDKDFAAAKLAEDVQADALVILTAVKCVAINFGKENQEDLHEVKVSELERYSKEGQFAPGSMLPKVQAACSFAAAGKGATIITSLENANNIFDPSAVTTVRG